MKQQATQGTKLKRLGGGALVLLAGLAGILSIEQTQATTFTYSTSEVCIKGTGPDWYHSIPVASGLRIRCNPDSHFAGHPV